MRNVVGILLLAAVSAVAQEHAAPSHVPSGDATGHAQAPMEPSVNQGQEHAQAAAKHGEGHEEAPMPNEIWWKWANFAILAGGLGYLIGKNAGPFFRYRKSEIQRGIQEAAEVRAEAEARAAQIESRIGNLSAEVDALRAKSREEIAAEGARVQAETQAQVAKIQAHAQAEIVLATKHATAQLKAYSAELALALAEKQVRARADAATQQQLANAFIQDLRGEEATSAGGLQ